MRKSKNLLIVAVLVLAMFAVGCLGGDNYTRGVITDDGFESEFLNLRFTLPAGFHMLSEEDLEDLVEFAGEIIRDNEGRIDFAEALTVMEMMAVAPMGSPSVGVAVERVPARMTVEAYLESMKEEALEEMSAQGMDITFSDETVTVEFAGETYTQLSATMYMFGMEVNQRYLVRQIGNRMVGLAFSYFPEAEAELQVLIDAFEPL